MHDRLPETEFLFFQKWLLQGIEPRSPCEGGCYLPPKKQKISHKELDKCLYCSPNITQSVKRPTIIGAPVGGKGEEICGISMLAPFFFFPSYFSQRCPI